MIKYNLYYNYTKINNKPLSEEEASKIRSKQYIYKNINGINNKIPVAKIKFTKCTIL